MIALFLELILAILVSWFAYTWKWWLVAITFPFIMSKSNLMFDKPMSKTNNRRVIDTIIIIIQIAYIISQVIIFHINIGDWYGWLVGLLVGYFLMGWMAPKRWAYEV